MHSVLRASLTDAAVIGALVRNLVGDSLIDPESEEAERFYGTLAQLKSPNLWLFPIASTQWLR
jgi:hypothetical protein